MTKGNINGVIRGIFEIVSRTLKFTTFYSIFATFFRVHILEVKVINLRVLVTISKIALMTPFVFPQITQNDFHWEISISQHGCRGGGAKTFLRFGASSRSILRVHVWTQMDSNIFVVF